MKNDNLCVNTLRALSLEQIYTAKSGHPGIALGAAPILFALYSQILNVTPKAEKHILRDRFVLSAGHGSALLYSTLNAFGFSFSLDDLKNFRKVNSRCPGHPEVEAHNAVDASTGPLGQGVANAVGMAIAEKHLASIFNKPDFELFNNYTYCLVGDGCLMEGVANEALSLAGTLKLNKLIVIYDCNKVTLDGKTDETFKQNTALIFKGYGFNVIEVKDGNNVSKIVSAIKSAKKSSKPSLIIVNTVIGYGASNAGTNEVHGKPISVEETETLKRNYGLLTKPFEINKKVKDLFNAYAKRYEKVYNEFEEKLKIYKQNYPAAYKNLNEFLKNDFSNVDNILKDLQNKKTSTRSASGEILTLIADNYSNIIGGSADVYSSTKAYINSSKFNVTPAGRNIMFGIREFAMSAICNGIALYGGLTPFASTFMVFADYLKAGLRMSALSKLKVLYVLSHDSIMVGQDGPTHEPIEQIAMLRAQPNTYVFRPCDFVETAACYSVALNTQAPSVMVLSRQDLNLQNSNYEKAKQGAYVIKQESKDKLDLVLIATGSEVSLAVEVASELEESGLSVRVVSMPCMEVFDNQTQNYKDKILPKDTLTFAIEYSSDLSFYKYISKGEVIGINTFGLSGEPHEIAKELGVDKKGIINKIKKHLKTK